MSILDETFLDDKLAELEKLHAWSPRSISKLESFIRTGDEWAVFRANPFYFAEERGVSEDEAVDLFLLASKVGLFQMTWSLVCPGCGAAVQSFATLRSVCSKFHCFLCSTDIETRLDDYVQVGFTVSPKIRSIPAHDPSRLCVEDYYAKYHHTREIRFTPGGPRFADAILEMKLALSYLEPRATQTFEIEVGAGAVAIHDAITNALFVLVVDPSHPSPNSTLRFSISQGLQAPAPVVVSPGKVKIEIDNDSDSRNSVLIFFKPQAMLDEAEAAAKAGVTLAMHFDKFLSGRRLLTSHTFRRTFGTEIIRSSDGIGVRDISILFTDLKGSTEMYDRIGNLRAFALVNQHFDRLGRAIINHHGAVVKTIGDAVMASFESPVDAVRAARDMLTEIEAFNQEVGEREIVLKVGVHRGASIAVTLNDRLDFFGQTVNIAARVQGLADADEIYITDDVHQAPGVKDLLADFHVTKKEVSLRGVQRAVSVYRIAIAPEGAAS